MGTPSTSTQIVHGLNCLDLFVLSRLVLFSTCPSFCQVFQTSKCSLRCLDGARCNPPKEEASESSEPADTQSGTAPPKAESTPAPEQPVSSGGRLQPALERAPNASAAAVRLAIETGVKIAGLKGTGTGGQITEADVKKASSGGSTAAPGAAPAASYTDTPISSMRKTIANRLTESMNRNPHYFVAASVSVTKLMKLRAALNASADGKYKLSVNDFLIKACGVACKKVPTVNSSWRDGFI